MPIDMSNVNKIVMPESKSTIYKKTFSFTNTNLFIKGTNNNGYIRLTVYSTSTPSESITTTGGATLYNFLASLGYQKYGTYSAISIPIDNPYECEYNYNGTRCPYASFSSRSSQGTLMFFSVPEGASTNGGTFTVTSTDWEPYFTFSVPIAQEFKYYLNSTAGSYTRFEVASDISTGQEYISNYVINGVSYPNVTISSVSGATYTLSDGNTYTVYTTYSPSITFSPVMKEKEVYSIIDITGNILWEKVGVYYGYYYIKVGGYYLNYASNYNVTTSTTASTVWHIEDDNRVSCLDGDTKKYLQFQKTGNNHPVFVDTKDSSGYDWVYKDDTYIKGTISGITYYLYRYGAGTSGVRMHTDSTRLTFESADPRRHTPDWHTIWEGDYSITCEAINGERVNHPESNMVVYHIFPKISSIATAYSDMKIKVYYQFDWIGDRGETTPADSYRTEFTISDLSSDKTILNIPVNPIDSYYSSIDFIASTAYWEAATGNIIFQCRGILHPDDTQYMKSVIRITKIELYC